MMAYIGNANYLNSVDQMCDGRIQVDLAVEIRLPIALQQRLIIAPSSVVEAVPFA